MERQFGPWTVKSTAEKYADSFIRVRVDQVIRPDGEPGTYSTVGVKPGVAVLPVDEGGNVYLVKQYRYALGSESLEVACGGVEEGETPVQAAGKELREELGIRASELTDLGTIDLDTSIVACKMGLFLARGLALGETEQEGTERIRSIKVSFDRAVQMVMDSEITHAASCVLILKSRGVLEG